MLNACLASLHVQNGGPGQLLVTCNSTDDVVINACGGISELYGAEMIATGCAGAQSCYDSAEMGATRATEEWISFPSDDSLYVYDFARILQEVGEGTKADLVYCDCVYRQEASKGDWPPFNVLDVSPRMGRIDKTTFIMRRKLFKGFPAHPRGWRDGALIEQLMKDGARAVKAPGVLVIHQ